MVLSEFKENLLNNINNGNRTELPADNIIIERIYAGMKKIAHETLVIRYCVNSSRGVQILRKIDNYTYIRFPNKPISNDSEIDMDASLMDALYRYVLAGLERSNAQTHMSLFNLHIIDNNAKLIEADMDESESGSNFGSANARFV